MSYGVSLTVGIIALAALILAAAALTLTVLVMRQNSAVVRDLRRHRRAHAHAEGTPDPQPYEPPPAPADDRYGPTCPECGVPCGGHLTSCPAAAEGTPDPQPHEPEHWLDVAHAATPPTYVPRGADGALDLDHPTDEPPTDVIPAQRPRPTPQERP
jgi:hypothetical protein